MSEVLYRLEQSILNEPDSFSMFKDDLLGWIELLKEKQPQLNENQQEMLQEVIKQYDITKPKTVLHALEHLSMIAFLLDEMDEVTEEDCIVVAQAFLDWAQEQEEE
ncbi:hypothetical protein [Enterococcus innesii]|uniref:hypothetical protein n=1 Tax=Enterococcus innesii TaxID=2839759 RepID=UPI0032E48DFA